MAGDYVFTLAVRVPVCPSVSSMYVHPSALRFCLITEVFINRFHSNIAYAFASTISRLGLLMGQISIIYLRVMALVNVQKMDFGTQTNSADPDETPHNASSHQSFHCLHKKKSINVKLMKKIINLTPLK